MDDIFQLRPVGRVISPFTDPSAAPHQGRDAGTEVVVEIDQRYAEALDGIDEHELLIVLCWLHLASRDRLKVHPRGDRKNPRRGIFATRSPLRPNPIAVYTARLLGREGRKLRLGGIDAVDGTPVIDIRPHFHRLDD